MIESTIEQVTGGDVEIGGNTVPEGFPAEVPLVPGDVINGSSATKDEHKVWNVTIKVARRRDVRLDRRRARGRGFAPSDGVGAESSDGQTGLFENGSYSVLLSMTTQDVIGTIANYTVTAT